MSLLDTWIGDAINKWLKILKQSVNDKTPEDTLTLLGNNEIIGPIQQGSIIMWEVKNETPYATYVEYGIPGKKYNYHKPKWTVMYRWVGARMFTRTKLEKEKEILALVKSNINKTIISLNNDKWIKLA